MAIPGLKIRVPSGVPRATHILATIAVVLLVTACAQRVLNVENETLMVPESASASQVEWAIGSAAAMRGWKVERIEPGRLEARRQLKKHVLVVEITHTKEEISILYKDSENLKYNGTRIHKLANKWILNLKREIVSRTAKITAQAAITEDQPETEDVPDSNREVRPSILRQVSRSSDLRRVASGSGFVVSDDGLVVTNDHVIKACGEVRIRSEVFEVLERDESNDLALLKGETRHSGQIAVFRSGRGIRLGEDVIVAGYPLQDYIRSGLNVTKGSVSALPSTGYIQLTAPIQPGNSGGPMLDTSGNVVGVVVSKLDEVKMVKSTGRFPQNVNFAISGGIVRAFLDSRNVAYGTAASRKTLPAADIASKARGFTVLIECWN